MEEYCCKIVQYRKVKVLINQEADCMKNFNFCYLCWAIFWNNCSKKRGNENSSSIGSPTGQVSVEGKWWESNLPNDILNSPSIFPLVSNLMRKILESMV